jgi:hypothetical protein
MDPSWLIFAAANGFGNHWLWIGVMNGILSQSQIPRARGTVSQVPADGFSLMLSQVGSIFQRDTTGTWYLVEDTARPISARPSLPHQIDLILAKLTLRRMILTKRGGVATPVKSGRSLSPTLPHPMSYVGAILSTIGRDCQPSSQVLQSTTANESAAITLHQTAC